MINESTKVGAKLLSDLVIFSIFSTDIPLDFYESIWVVPLKYLMCFLTMYKYYICWNIPEEKLFTISLILLFI